MAAAFRPGRVLPTMIPIFSISLLLPSGAVPNSVWPVWQPRASALTDGLLNEVRPNRRNVRLGIAQSGGGCVDRVGAEDEIVLVRDGRAENEFSCIRDLGSGIKLGHSPQFFLFFP
jgi:hypothetical protein